MTMPTNSITPFRDCARQTNKVIGDAKEGGDGVATGGGGERTWVRENETEETLMPTKS